MLLKKLAALLNCFIAHGNKLLTLFESIFLAALVKPRKASILLVVLKSSGCHQVHQGELHDKAPAMILDCTLEIALGV